MSENQNETPTIDDAVEETRDLIDRMASAIKSVKGSQAAINAQDIPNEIRSIIGASPVTKTYYAVRPYLSDIGDLLRPYVDFSLDTTNLSSWLNSIPRNDFTNTYTYKYKNSYATHFANRGKLYTESALQTIIEKCSDLAREDFDTSKGYLTILEYQELYNEAHTRVTDFCLYLYKQVYTISEYQGTTVYTLESDTNVARLNISAGNTLSISSIITENIPQRADINSTSMDSPIYNAANCVLYGYNYYDNVLNKMTVKRVNTINAQDFPDVIETIDTRYLAPNGQKYYNKYTFYATYTHTAGTTGANIWSDYKLGTTPELNNVVVYWNVQNNTYGYPDCNSGTNKETSFTYKNDYYVQTGSLSNQSIQIGTPGVYPYATVNTDIPVFSTQQELKNYLTS